MKLTVQKITLLFSLLFSSLVVASSPFPTQEPMGGAEFGHSVKHVGNGIYVFRWWVYRNFFVVTDDGVIVSDPLNPKAAKLLQSEIRKITDKPVKYVIYSHNHHDHVSGGNIFQAEGAKFIAQKNMLKQLKDHPSPVLPTPDIVFDDHYTVELGGRSIELSYFGPNHGDSLVVMCFPEEKILFVVDIVTPRRVAFRGMPDFWPDEWVRSLKAIELMDVDYVISAHGPETEPAIDPASVIKDQRIYIEDLMAAVKKAMDEGTHSPDALKKQVKLPKYENWQYYDAWLPMNIERIWAYYHMGW